MSNKTHLSVLTPKKVLFDGEVDSVVIKGTEGELGILFDHIPLASQLSIGTLKYRQGKDVNTIAISNGGFLEVMPNKVTVLADQGELPDEIDVERATEAMERARKRLAGQGDDPDVDFARARFALMRAAARIRAAGDE